MMRLLVTGGSGFLGGYVLDEAARQGHDCFALARSPAAAAAVAARGATPLDGDLNDGALPGIFARAQCAGLVNLASLGFGHASAIVAAAEAAGLDRGVFVSTTAVTTALPARSVAVRLAAEDSVRRAKLGWTILRPTMIYGAAGDRNMSRLLALLASRRVPMLPVPGGGQRLQQPVHVADVATAVLACVRRPQASTAKRYDLAGPVPMPFAELLDIAADAVGARARLMPVPLGPVVAATRCYERVSRHPRIRAEQWQRLAEDKAFPIDAAVRDLEYAPRSFSDGIRAEAAALGLAAPSSSSQPSTLPRPSAPSWRKHAWRNHA